MQKKHTIIINVDNFEMLDNQEQRRHKNANLIVFFKEKQQQYTQINY